MDCTNFVATSATSEGDRTNDRRARTLAQRPREGRLRPRQLLALALLALLGSVERGTAAAQGPAGVRWGVPTLLSADVPKSTRPIVVADAFGMVHVFWEAGYTPFPQSPEVGGSVIYYSRLDGDQWSPPVDIIIAPGAYSLAWQMTAAADTKGNLHAAYTSGGVLYYTQAPVTGAGDARKWSAPLTLADATQTPYLLVTPQGILHLFNWNVGDQPGVYHRSSDDGGRRWTDEHFVGLASLDSPRPPGKADAITAVMDAQNRLHVIWYDIFADRAVQYARSTDNGAFWTPPLTLDADGVTPSIAVDARGTLIAVWRATHDRARCGHYMSTSGDAGIKWTPLRRVLAPMEGCLHPTAFVEDSRHILQFGVVARDDKAVTRLWYGTWGGADWGFPVPFTAVAVREGDDWQQSGPDRMKVAISGGNRLYAVWYTNDQRIWYVRGDLPAPAVAPLSLPTTVPTRVPTAKPTPLTAPVAAPSPRATALPGAGDPGFEPQSAQWSLLAGIVPVIGLILMLVVTRLLRRA